MDLLRPSVRFFNKIHSIRFRAKCLRLCPDIFAPARLNVTCYVAGGRGVFGVKISAALVLASNSCASKYMSSSFIDVFDGGLVEKSIEGRIPPFHHAG